MAEAVEVVLTSLPTPEIVHEVALGDARDRARARGSKRLIELSTIGPGAATRIAAGLEERAIEWVEAPVSGGVRGARTARSRSWSPVPGRPSGPSSRS